MNTAEIKKEQIAKETRLNELKKISKKLEGEIAILQKDLYNLSIEYMRSLKRKE